MTSVTGPTLPTGTISESISDPSDSAAQSLPSAEPAVPSQENTDGLTTGQMNAVETRQVELMAVESVDGRPPTSRQRWYGWMWVTAGLTLVVVAAAITLLIGGMSFGLLLGSGFVLLLVLLIGGWPVWSAGLSRGKEEAIARQAALVEVRTNSGPNEGLDVGASGNAEVIPPLELHPSPVGVKPS